MTAQLGDDAPAVAALLGAWLPAQRWFAGKGRATQIAARLLTRRVEDRYEVQEWLADAAYAEGDAETYQIPMVVLDEPSESLAHVFIGRLSAPDRADRFLYDALHDKSVTQGWLDDIRGGAQRDGIEFIPTAEPDAIPADQPSLVLTGEQSNTSLVFGDAVILKVFRRLERGENPDIEVHRALGELGDSHVARLLGYVQHVDAGADAGAEQVTSLAMLQQFLPSATDGWELAKTSVRDLMGEADLHAEEAGGDFAGEAERLGAAVAGVHADLRRAFGSVILDRAALHAAAEQMTRRLDQAIGIVPQLGEVAAALREAYDDLATLSAHAVAAQRIHGDLHLGQTLRTTAGWVLLDFEGEPAKAIAHRRAPDSPVRDIAGMLRSLDYVARHQLVDGPTSPQTEYRAAEWAARNRDAFCAGYRAASDDADIDPVLLRAYEADKAVYEAVYEIRNRPGWLPVPLASLARLAGTGQTPSSSAAPSSPPPWNSPTSSTPQEHP